MFCLIETVHHINIAIIIENAVIRRVKEDKIISLGHIEYIIVIKIKQFRSL